MCTGSDSYAITQNWICGNFSTSGDGGGIGHFGLSDGTYQRIDPRLGGDQDQYWLIDNIPLIADNTVIFNKNYDNQGATQELRRRHLHRQRPAAGRRQPPPSAPAT